MTLSMDVLRLVTWKALIDKTWAMNRIYDSPSLPTDVRVESDNEPFIAVYVDDADFDVAASDDKSIMGGPGVIRLILEVAVGSPQTDSPVAGEDQPGMGGVTRINATDPALELQMGLVTRQALQALLSVNVASPWSEIWRAFVLNLIKVEVRRGGPGQQAGQPKPRFASRLVVLHLDTVGEPVRGDDLTEFPVWNTFLEAAEDDPQLAGTAALIRAHIEHPGGPLPQWRIDQKVLMTTRQTMVDIGVGPQEGFDETVHIEIIPELERVTPIDLPPEPAPPGMVKQWIEAEQRFGWVEVVPPSTEPPFP